MAEKRKYRFRHITPEDTDIIWSAYLSGSFPLPEMKKLQFIGWWMETKKQYQEILIVEADNRPIAFVAAYFDGWKYEPHVEFFSWATKRSILESSVDFFTEMGKQNVGVVIVKSLKPSTNLFNHCCRRGCLEFIGMIPNGDYRGNEYIYTRAGDAICPRPITSPITNI